MDFAGLSWCFRNWGFEFAIFDRQNFWHFIGLLLCFCLSVKLCAIAKVFNHAKKLKYNNFQIRKKM